MLINNYSGRDRVVQSLNKFLQKMLDKDIIGDFGIDTSGGMGSFETFYISIDGVDEDENFTIRFSNHDIKNNNSISDYYLWSDDFKSIKELKTVISEIIENHSFGYVYDFECKACGHEYGAGFEKCLHCQGEVVEKK